MKNFRQQWNNTKDLFRCWRSKAIIAATPWIESAKIAIGIAWSKTLSVAVSFFVRVKTSVKVITSRFFSYVRKSAIEAVKKMKRIPKLLVTYVLLIVGGFIALMTAITGSGGEATNGVVEHLYAIALAVLLVLVVSVVVWLIKKWRNRPKKETSVIPTPPATTTPAAKPTTAVTKKAKPEKTANALTDIRTYLALASVVLLVTFNDTFFGEVVGVEYTVPGGQLYVPLAGLLYYTLGFVAAGLLMGVMEDSGNPLSLMASIGIGIATTIAGWVNGWYLPFPTPHTVGHEFLGNIVFPADVMLPWWVVAVSIGVLIMATRDVDMRYTIWTKMDFNLVLVSISFCLFAPQILPQLVDYIF